MNDSTRVRRRARLGSVLAVCAIVAGVAAATSSDAVAPEASPAAAPSCGASLPKPGGGTWACVFDDEFDGTTVDRSKWTVQVTADTHYHSGKECYVDDPENVSVANGYLELTVQKEQKQFLCGRNGMAGYLTQYTSGMLMSTDSWVGGRFEVRAKLPSVVKKGVQTSFWLFPVEQIYGTMHRSGEIDIGEWYSQYPDLMVPYVHYFDAKLDPNVTNNHCVIDDVTAAHTYTVEWTDDSMTFLYDGEVCLVDDWKPVPPQVKPQPFDHPFMLSLTQALGINTNGFNAWITQLPATTSVDYVRIWQ